MRLRLPLWACFYPSYRLLRGSSMSSGPPRFSQVLLVRRIGGYRLCHFLNQLQWIHGRLYHQARAPHRPAIQTQACGRTWALMSFNCHHPRLHTVNPTRLQHRALLNITAPQCLLPIFLNCLCRARSCNSHVAPVLGMVASVGRILIKALLYHTRCEWSSFPTSSFLRHRRQSHRARLSAAALFEDITSDEIPCSTVQIRYHHRQAF